MTRDTDTNTGRIRLACRYCMREDGDGIGDDELARFIAGGWRDVGPYQGDDDPNDAPRGYSVPDWHTHLGTCPDCGREE